MADGNVAQPSESDLYERREEIRRIRHALLIGLESFGEIERVIDLHELLSGSENPPDHELRPLHPTGSPNTIGVFACALRLLESMEVAHG